jgi:hypothetical protein
MSSDQQLFEIEKEYDQRYEGLDFDVDERPLQLGESQANLPVELPPPSSQKTEDDIHCTIETLERAEALEEQLHAQRNPKHRITDRLEATTNKGSLTARGDNVAAPLASSQGKLANALAANSDLASSIKNSFAFVAALTLELIPEGTSKSTLLSKLASALRYLKTSPSQQKLFNSLGLPENTTFTTKIDKSTSAQFSTEIKRAFELANGCKEANTSTLEEQTVRSLLKLATAPVTVKLLSECDQAGKKMRKLKNHPVQSIAQASEAVVNSWKQTLTLI